VLPFLYTVKEAVLLPPVTWTETLAVTNILLEADEGVIVTDKVLDPVT